MSLGARSPFVTKLVAGMLGVSSVAAVGLAGERVAALFTSPVTASMNLTVGPPVVPRPATVSCSTQGTPLVVRWARFTWTPPAAPAPQPTGYRIRILDGGDEVLIAGVAGSVTTYDVTTGLLVGSLAWVLQLLLGGGTRPATVNAVYGTYESPSVWTHHLRGELGLVSGIGCASGPSP